MDQKQEIMNVLYASNDGYACHLAASLFSLYQHHAQSVPLDVYVLSAGMCAEYQDNLKEIAGRFHRSLTIIELGDLRNRFPYEVDTRGFDLSAMSRLFAPEVLPESVDRILYLDCDTIICASLLPVYHMDLNGCLAAMAMEPTVYKKMKETIGFTKSDPYYNSGVILMDLHGWRREGVLKQMLDFYGSHSGSLFACDQDTINGTLKGRILPLPPAYNFFTNYRYFHYGTLVKMCPAYKTVTRAEFRQAVRTPAVIHFLGDERPWIAGNHNHYRKYYEDALAHTPWRGMEKQAGKELYMHLWWVFNHISWLCPPVRLLISKYFGMKLVDSRKSASKKASSKKHKLTGSQKSTSKKQK